MVALVFKGRNRLPLRMGHQAPVLKAWHLEASVYDSVHQKLEGRPVSWTTLDSTVATVDSTGHMRAVGTGATHIKASSGGAYGYSRVKSYARPVDRAELDFYGLVSQEAGWVILPSVDTVWVDSAGTEHPAFIQIRPGALSMEWSDGGGTYEQRLVLSTVILEGLTLVQVEQSEYLDTGTLEHWWDGFEGREWFKFTSMATPGLVYSATWTIPGELVIEQPVGGIPVRAYYFDLR